MCLFVDLSDWMNVFQESPVFVYRTPVHVVRILTLSCHACIIIINIILCFQKKAPSAAPLQRAAAAVVHFCDYHRPKVCACAASCIASNCGFACFCF